MENRRRNIPENEGMHESNLQQTGEVQVTTDDAIPMPPQKKKLNKNTKKIILAIVAVFVVALLAVAGYAASVFFLYEPEVGNTNTVEDLPFVPSVDQNNVDENGEVIKIETVDKQYNFLVAARDDVSGLTDVIMIINYNITKQSLSVMQVPRDTYVEIDNYSYHKINGAFGYYKNSYRGDNAIKDGLRDFADYLEKNLCIKIHYTAMMDLEGFSNIVNAIGGVYMYVPQDMYYNDPNQNLYINLKKGYQTLDGVTAKQFVRYRYGLANGDIGRGDMQKLFMTAFIEKLQSSISGKNVSKLTELAGSVYECLETDLTVNDMVYFGKNFLGLTGGAAVDMNNINMITMPGGAFFDDLSYYSLNRESTVDIINKFFNIYNFDISSSFDPNKVFLKENSEKSKYMYDLPMDKLDTDIFNAGEDGNS